MFKKSAIISLSVFFILMIFTSVVKNNTRNIEKNIKSLNDDVSILEKELIYAKIDFIYLSSPDKLIQNLSNFGHKKYYSYDHSRIFLSTQDFINHTSQEVKYFLKKIDTEENKK
tara:strand:+ start:309 stop:650 length:342 start_codon:yes stop_codon:yes gene_type:complete